MPRSERQDKSLITKLLCSFKDKIITSGKIVEPTNRVWIEISKALDNRITPKYAYTLVKNNRYNLWRLLNIDDNSANINQSVILSEENVEAEDSTDDDRTNSLNFNISFSTNEWKKLIRTVEYRRSDDRSTTKRKYDILNPYEWSDKIHEKFYQETHVACCITYKRAKILPNGAVFLKIQGVCSVCNSIFEATKYGKEDGEHDSTVFLQCSYKGDFLHCQSRKKRNLSGSRRKKIIDKLVKENKSASHIRRIMALKGMNYGEKEPSHLPSSNQLRTLKCRVKKLKVLDENPILSIVRLKGEIPYNTIIRDVGLERFFVQYWSTTEINSYREYCKRVEFPKIAIDATGGLVTKIKHFSGEKSSAIFLYEISVYDDVMKNQFSVGHFLSERHDNNSISHWLSEWVRSSVKSPKLVVTDQSLALMMAVTRSFTQFSSFAVYLRICSELIIGKTTEVPICQIRNDVNHIMHLISTWQPLKTAVPRVKQFYMRAIGLIVQSTNFDEAKTLLRFIFTIALHEYEGFNEESGLSTQCEIAKNFLKNQISGISSIEMGLLSNLDFSAESDEAIQSDVDDSGELIENEVFYQIKNIYNTVKDSATLHDNRGNRDNAHFSPQIANKLLDFCKLITVWSAIMTPIFQYGGVTETSAHCESIFNDIKNRTFKHVSLPIRVDRFLKKHIDSNLGEMKLIKAKSLSANLNIIENDVPSSPDIESSNLSSQIIESDPVQVNFCEENWRGLAKPIKNYTRKKNYLQPDPSVRSLNINSKSKSPVIGILKNGNISELRSIKIGSECFIFQNTCAFDSLIQLLCTAYADSNEYTQFVNEREHEILFVLIKNMIRDGVTTQAYRKRGTLLQNIFPSKNSRQNILICDATTTVTYLARKLFVNFPSTKEKTCCVNCLHTSLQDRILMIANVNENSTEDIANAIQESVNVSKCICSNCKSVNVIRDFVLSSHLLIELYSPDQSSRHDLCTTLDHIPTNLSLTDNIYRLRGVVNFLPPSANDGIGHYVAYAYRERNDIWEVYDDLQNSSIRVRSTTYLKNIQMMVYSI